MHIFPEHVGYWLPEMQVWTSKKCGGSTNDRDGLNLWCLHRLRDEHPELPAVKTTVPGWSSQPQRIQVDHAQHGPYPLALLTMSQDCSSWKTGVHLNAWGSSHLRCGQGGLGSKDDFIMNRGWKSIRKQILPYLSTLIYMFCALGDKSNTIPQRPTPYLRFMRAQYHVWMLTHPEAEMPTIKLHLEGPVARRPRGGWETYLFCCHISANVSQHLFGHRSTCLCKQWVKKGIDTDDGVNI